MAETNQNPQAPTVEQVVERNDETRTNVTHKSNLTNTKVKAETFTDPKSDNYDPLLARVNTQRVEDTNAQEQQERLEKEARARSSK